MSNCQNIIAAFATNDNNYKRENVITAIYLVILLYHTYIVFIYKFIVNGNMKREFPRKIIIICKLVQSILSWFIFFLLKYGPKTNATNGQTVI